MNLGSIYNEARDEEGHLRASYRAFRARTGTDPLSPSFDVCAALAGCPLGDRSTIFPIPLVLDDHEYRHTIARGARQRALALQSLFHDLIGGESCVFRDTQLPKDLFPRILRQEGHGPDDVARWWQGRSQDAVRFVYAPDLVRASDGRWLVLEDNLGCVGGVVDSCLVSERFLAHAGTRQHPSVPSGSDLVRAVRAFLSRVGKTPESPDVVALLAHECGGTDSEASRTRQVLRAQGIRVLDGVELEEARRQGLRPSDVGAVVNFDMRGWMPTCELTDEMFGTRGIPLMTAPGVEALGNKALLPFLDEIVSFYSREDPILPTAKTELYRGMPDDPSGWVIKKSHGCQGKDVFVLDGMSDADRSALDARQSRWGDSPCAVMQRLVRASFLPLSTGTATERFQVELRPLVFVVGDSVCVTAEHASGRAFRNVDGRGLGNISQGAQHLAVIREPTSPAGLIRDRG